jgi:hypothetical protein
MDESAPLLKFSTETDKRYSVADLKALIDAGALTTDPGLEAYIRAEGDLLEKPEDEDTGGEVVPLKPAARGPHQGKGRYGAQSGNDCGRPDASSQPFAA